MQPPCTNWTTIDGIDHGGNCALRKASVSFGVCANACTEQDGDWRAKLKEGLAGKLAAAPAPAPTSVDDYWDKQIKAVGGCVGCGR